MLNNALLLDSISVRWVNLNQHREMNMKRILLSIYLPTLFSIFCIVMLTYSLFFVLPLVFSVGDALARYKEFTKYKDFVTYNDARRLRHSRCQRNAIIAASKHPASFRAYYRTLGYRWYHILPDGTFSIKNNCYLKPKFYKKLLGL